uniref:Uncharacterized protein n=1 Tax=Arabidopsis thaliana TaxID=3702 RepID=Q0WR99_ARATH|nr:hypothetical protein [Arabidopsis thaliana]
MIVTDPKPLRKRQVEIFNLVGVPKPLRKRQVLNFSSGCFTNLRVKMRKRRRRRVVVGKKRFL